MDWSGWSVLVTGGTGSFGQHLVGHLLAERRPRRLIVFSRDEVKQLEMRRRFPDDPGSPLRYFIGDVRDRARLYRAFKRVDVVIHAAALKQVPTAEYNPLEVIHTNVLGAANVIDAAVDCGVQRVVALSTDKAVGPVNLYGATKLCADKLFLAAGVYTDLAEPRFAVVRYGNVVGSRGSVVPLFLEHRASGALPITDPRMTRFWITLDQAVALVVDAVEHMRGGEIFVPKIPSMRITDLALAVGPDCVHRHVGIRPGEKLHEILLTEDEARRTVELDDCYVVLPDAGAGGSRAAYGGRPIPEDFRYGSDTNDHWLGIDEMRELLGLAEKEKPPASR